MDALQLVNVTNNIASTKETDFTHPIPIGFFDGFFYKYAILHIYYKSLDTYYTISENLMGVRT